MRKKILLEEESQWKTIKLKNDKKIEWLLAKYGYRRPTGKRLEEGLSEEDIQLLADIKYSDKDLEERMKDYKEKEPPIYGDVQVSENVKALLKLDPKLATLGKIVMRDIKAEMEL